MTTTTNAVDVTIGTALRSAARRLHSVSVSPDLDASLLLAHMLDRPRSYLIAHDRDALDAADAAAFEALVVRRERGEPMAYLLGYRGFWSLDLTVSDAVLVPRPETETLVEAALARLPDNAALTVADLGTGSGAIALAIAAERPECQVVATDIDPETLSVAHNNAQRLGLSHVECRKGDWFQPLADEHFDLIAANPPYVSGDDPHLADLIFEPHAALVADDNGGACLRYLIEQAPDHLAGGGWLLLEHGMDQDAFVRELMAAAEFVDVASTEDLAGHPRVTLGRRPEPAP